MPPSWLCPGGDHRPPPPAACACGMVTRVPSRAPSRPARAPGPLVPPDIRDASHAASTTARVTRSHPTPTTTASPTCRSPACCASAPTGCSPLSDAGLVVTADGEPNVA